MEFEIPCGIRGKAPGGDHWRYYTKDLDLEVNGSLRAGNSMIGVSQLDQDSAMQMHPNAKASIAATEPAQPHSIGHAAGGTCDPSTGLIVAVGGSAIAIGDTTTATGFVENFAADKGNVSIAMGEAFFQAAADATTPHGALAAATTFLDVTGADIVFERESGHAKHGAHDAWAVSELDYFAIDIHGWSPPNGPIVIDLHQPFHHHGHAFALEAFSGNFAHVFAAAETHGVDGFSATFTEAMTIENHFSFVNATGLVAL
jgi:hypothetical protein